jgi:opacity protein-like surface antigen
MKSIAFVVAATFAASLSAPAYAQSAPAEAGNYVQFALGSAVAGETKLSVSGVGSEDADLKAGFFGAVSGGRSYGNGFALEAEGIYLKNDIKTGSLSALLGTPPLDASARTYGLMLNAHYAALPLGPFTGEIGAGLGYGQTKYELLGASDEANGLMWQIIAGLSYPVSEKLSWALNYRYLRGPKLNYDDIPVGAATYDVDLKTSAHVVSVGARMKF